MKRRPSSGTMLKLVLRIQGEQKSTTALAVQLTYVYLTLTLRFLLVVLSAYKQMHNQTKAILSDVQEDNFDKAFKLFRPGDCFMIHYYFSSHSYRFI